MASVLAKGGARPRRGSRLACAIARASRARRHGWLSPGGVISAGHERSLDGVFGCGATLLPNAGVVPGRLPVCRRLPNCPADPAVSPTRQRRWCEPGGGCSQPETRVLLCRTAAVLLLAFDVPAMGGAMGPASAVASVAAGLAALDLPAGGGAMGPASAVARVAAGLAALDLPAGGGAMGPASAVARVAAGLAALDLPAGGGAMGPASAVAGGAAGPAALTIVPRAATAARVGIVSRASSRTVRSRSATALTRSPLTRRNRERSPAASRSLTRPCTSGP